MPIDFSLLHTGPFAPEQIRLCLAPGLRIYPSAITRLIEAAWEAARRQSGIKLWDGPAYSLLGSRVENGALLCQVQQTTYKAFFGANVCHCDDIEDKSLLANSLACCCVCETTDDHVLLGLRSQSVAEDRGIWHIPGGNLDDIAAGDAAPFEQVRREVEEEAHVSAEHIAALTCLGMGRSLRTWKPEFLFHARLTLNAEQLRTRLAHAQDAGEHTEWRLVPSSGVAGFTDTHTVSPIGLAALALWRQLIHREEA
ncbi:MAG: NUDIX domain-containing protein [Candidatus Cloacimonetes bacterium]|nr:NUDIX domain-containing protein [Candidatus Cloacimonadota bacterium]